MPKIAYSVEHGRHEKRTFSHEGLALIHWADRLLSRYAAIGINVTGRSIYYRALDADTIPDSWIDPAYNAKKGLPALTKNTFKNYKRMMDLFAAARLAGLIDWRHLKDNLRGVEEVSHWDSPQSIMNAVAMSYQRDKWETQPNRVEVWIEKDALEGTLAAVCPQLDVPYFVCRGYPSLTGMWDNAQRLQGYIDAGQKPVILYLGDHDPSGIDIPRNIGAMLETFLGEEVEIERLALNMSQVRELRLNPNPAKTTDARWAGYVRTYGVDESWEVDAIDPEAMITLIQTGVARWRDDDAYEALEAQEAEEVELLTQARERWTEVADFLRSH